jgi:hypothetical protein
LKNIYEIHLGLKNSMQFKRRECEKTKLILWKKGLFVHNVKT